MAVRELTIRVKAPATRTYELPEGNFSIGSSISAFDEVTRKFQAATSVVIGEPDFKASELPLYLKVELVGGFVATAKSLTSEQVKGWALRAAQFTLIPYLREHVAALTGKAGFTPILIPLIQIPTERVSVTPPSPEELTFASTRAVLQGHLAKLMTEVLRSFNLKTHSKGGRLEGPDGFINPKTLRGQKLRQFESYKDEDGTEWRIQAVIEHSPDWRPVVKLSSDSIPPEVIEGKSASDTDSLLPPSRSYFERAVRLASSQSKNIFIEKSPTGGYEVKEGHSQRPRGKADTLEEAITLARRLSPHAAIHVERARDIKNVERWRKL